MLGATPREASLMARPRKPLQRLPQPGLNRGKVQRAIRRAFLLTVEAIAAFTSPAANRRSSSASDLTRCSRSRKVCPETDWVGKRPPIRR